jgi:hypothetical protein
MVLGLQSGSYNVDDFRFSIKDAKGRIRATSAAAGYIKSYDGARGRSPLHRV